MEEQLSCGGLMKQINDELRKNANNAMREQGLTMTQVGALIELIHAPEEQLSLKELEQRLHVAQSTMAGIVLRLEQKRLVESFGDASDRRIKRVRITREGVERVITAQKMMFQAEERLLSGLTAEERDIFLVLLRKVHNALL